MQGGAAHRGEQPPGEEDRAVRTAQRDLPLRDILDRARHDGGGGHAGRVELLTGIEGVSSHPVRRIVLREG